MWWWRHKETKEIVRTQGDRHWGYAGRSYPKFKKCRFTQAKVKPRDDSMRERARADRLGGCGRECHQCGRCRQCHTCTGCGRCKRYLKPYLDKHRALIALSSSRYLQDSGMLFKQIELVNHTGSSMEAMTNLVPDVDGYALKHEREGWFWSRKMDGKVWWKSAAGVAKARRNDEDIWAAECSRKMVDDFQKHGLIMVRGFADGTTQDMPHWTDY